MSERTCNKCGQAFDREQSVLVAYLADGGYAHIECPQTEAEQIEAWFANLRPVSTGYGRYCDKCGISTIFLNGEGEFNNGAKYHFRGDCQPKENIDHIPNGIYKESEFMKASQDYVEARWPSGANAKPDQPTEPSLSLIVCDFGTACVVHVQSPDTYNIAVIDGEVTDTFFGQYMTQVIDKPFAQVKEAIEGEKPVPRIERTVNIHNHYRVYTSTFPDGHGATLVQSEIDALSELAGKPLPLWNGGKWTQLAEEGDATQYPDDSLTMPVSIWRYTR